MQADADLDRITRPVVPLVMRQRTKRAAASWRHTKAMRVGISTATAGVHPIHRG